MLFFSPGVSPDPAGLILDAAAAAREQAMRVVRARRAAVLGARMLARIRSDRRAPD